MPLKNLFFLLVLFSSGLNTFAQNTNNLYPSRQQRQVSPGKTTYFIDPQNGSDSNKGRDRKKPWKTFKPVNKLILSAGDRLEILSPGTFRESLVLVTAGQKSMPVTIKFAPGRYDLFPDSALKQQLHISNTNNTPYVPKAIALMLDSCRFTNIEGTGAKFVLRGKMIETYLNNSEDISINGISFDYNRPTVSEVKVISLGKNYADLQVHPDSKYTIKDSLLIWEGEGWRHQPDYYWQELNPGNNELKRVDFPPKNLRYANLDQNKVRVYFNINPGFKIDFIYQSRDITRDCAGFFVQHSKNITLKNLRIYFMHGMGIVSQLSENIKMENVVVKPDEQSGRTCAAWADILHFSGCKGKIEITNCYLSGANDDAINIHGIHLKVIEIVNTNQLKVAYLHHETYGFNPYKPGDSLDLVRTETLLPIGSNVVANAKMINDKEILLTLKDPFPAGLKIGDAIENTTATPEILIRGNTINRIPTRGILVTSRRKTVIENNNLQRTHMSGVLVSDDAAYWFESGPVKNLMIRANHFEKCGEPVIAIAPENTEVGKTAVHSGISVVNNTFSLLGKGFFSAKSTTAIKIIQNKIKMPQPVGKIEDLIKLENCTGIQISDNVIIPQK